MYSYHLAQWLFFFYFYCLFGWCFESAYVSLRQKKFVNRGFMRGPFLPLYGSGAIMMLVVSMPVRGNLWLTYIAGCIGATVLEYVTGVTMEALFQVRYWDYSNQKFQYKGHICLSSTLAWGFLTILMTDCVHRPVEKFVLSIPMVILIPVVTVITVLVAVDFTLSFKAAMDLRDVLDKLQKVRGEMEHVQKRLDVLIALADEEFGRKVEESREEAAELRRRMAAFRERAMQLSSVRNFYRRHLILGNPTMYSEKFRETLEELKRAAAEHRKNRE